MINTLCVTYLFIFFPYLNKTDGQTLDTETRVYLFFWTEGVAYLYNSYL
jgi:hypothetical protein